MSNGRKPRRFGFGFVAFKKFPELIPLVSVVTLAIVGATAFVTYSLMKKPDIRLHHHGQGIVKTEWESVNPTDKRKLIIVNPDVYKPIEEVEELKKEIGSYKG